MSPTLSGPRTSQLSSNVDDSVDGRSAAPKRKSLSDVLQRATMMSQQNTAHDESSLSLVCIRVLYLYTSKYGLSLNSIVLRDAEILRHKQSTPQTAMPFSILSSRCEPSRLPRRFSPHRNLRQQQGLRWVGSPSPMVLFPKFVVVLVTFCARQFARATGTLHCCDLVANTYCHNRATTRHQRAPSARSSQFKNEGMLWSAFSRFVWEDLNLWHTNAVFRKLPPTWKKPPLQA